MQLIWENQQFMHINSYIDFAIVLLYLVVELALGIAC